MSTSPTLVNLTINGKAVQVPQGTSVFQAAEQVGIFIPHYCYHPDLSVAGVCRMCLCDVEKNPKLQISCNTPATEGMVVHTHNEKVKDAVKGVLELHLINHPLDCPICDKAGECKLQDFYVDYGLYQSRMDFDRKVHKPKVVDIGTIVLDSERCILCSRCVRFTAEVTETNELGIFNRGDRAELRTYDSKPLRNEYTGNLADICPVGALTAKDFRFAQRVWFLGKADSVCGLCAHGCNTAVSVNPKTKKLFRVEPRRNVDVNRSWICDRGRWNYHYVHNESRVKTPLKRVDGTQLAVPWEQVFRELHDVLASEAGGVMVALSTALTNEEIADTVTGFREAGVERFTWVVDEEVVDEKTPYDKILQHRDLTGNAAGFQTMMKQMGVTWLRQSEATNLLSSKGFKWLFVMGAEGETMPGLSPLLKAAGKSVKVALHATNVTPLTESAEYVLPNVSVFEKAGTFINAMGRLQRLSRALPWQYISRDAHGVLFGLRRGNDRESLPTGRVETVYASAVSQKLFGEELRLNDLNPMGVQL